MEKSILVVGIGTGGSRIAADIMRQCHLIEKDGAVDLLSEIDFNVSDTNQRSLRQIEDRIGPLAIDTFELGPKTTNRKGSGSSDLVAEKAWLESEERIGERFSKYNMVMPIFTTGGSTGKVCGPLAAALARKFKKYVIPVIARPAIGDAGISDQKVARAIALSESLVRCDDEQTGYRIIELLNKYAYQKRGVRQNEAMRVLNPPVANSIAGFLAYLADLTDFDLADHERWIYNGGGRIWIGYSSFALEADGKQISDEDFKQRCEEAVRQSMRQSVFQKGSRISGVERISIGNLYVEHTNAINSAFNREDQKRLEENGGPPYESLTVHTVAMHSKACRIIQIFSEKTDWNPDKLPAVEISDWKPIRLVQGSDEDSDPDEPLDVVWEPEPEGEPVGALPAAARAGEVEVSVNGNGTAVSETEAKSEFRGFEEFLLALADGEDDAVRLAKETPDIARFSRPLTATKLDRLLGEIKKVRSKFSEQWLAELLSVLQTQIKLKSELVKWDVQAGRLKPVGFETPTSRLRQMLTEGAPYGRLQSRDGSARMEIALRLEIIGIWGQEALYGFQTRPFQRSSNQGLTQSVVNALRTLTRRRAAAG